MSEGSTPMGAGKQFGKAWDEALRTVQQDEDEEVDKEIESENIERSVQATPVEKEKDS